MGKAQICVVCEGSGKYAQSMSPPGTTGSVTYVENVCHGCSGKGWVEVGHRGDEVYGPLPERYNPPTTDEIGELIRKHRDGRNEITKSGQGVEGE